MTTVWGMNAAAEYPSLRKHLECDNAFINHLFD